MSIVLFRSVDVETAGMNREIIEIGMSDVWFDTDSRVCEIAPPTSRLFGLVEPMEPGAQGTHHITAKELEGLPLCTEADLIETATAGSPQFLVGHNVAYERQYWNDDVMQAVNDFTGADSEVRWLDTFKSALRAWEEAPEHGLQALRYWRGLDLDPAYALPAHRGGPDAYVGAHLMGELAKTELIRDLVKWTMEPRHYPVCPIGKHRGQKWAEIPYSYLKWMTGGGNDIEFDLKFAANAEMNRRAEIGLR